MVSHDTNSSPPHRGGEGAAKRPERGRADIPLGEPSHETGTPGRRSPERIARARKLRRGGNLAEAALWNELKGRKLGGFKFVRQMPFGSYFADFACREHKLVVELDGSQHADSDYDRQRDAFMRDAGFSVIRFWNVDVLKHCDEVCETILAALDGRLSEDVNAVDLRFVYAAPKDPVEGAR